MIKFNHFNILMVCKFLFYQEIQVPIGYNRKHPRIITLNENIQKCTIIIILLFITYNQSIQPACLKNELEKIDNLPLALQVMFSVLMEIIFINYTYTTMVAIALWKKIKMQVSRRSIMMLNCGTIQNIWQVHNICVVYMMYIIVT